MIRARGPARRSCWRGSASGTGAREEVRMSWGCSGAAARPVKRAGARGVDTGTAASSRDAIAMDDARGHAAAFGAAVPRGGRMPAKSP
jgi:hypothetical protein